MDQRSKLQILGDVVENFVARTLRGERPEIEEYASRHPDLSDQIRRLLAALDDVVAPAEDRSSARRSASKEGADSPPATQLGDFRVIRQIGRGGMGIVYEAEQLSLGRRVALKVLPQQLITDDHQKLRFERESRAAARLHHTNIVPVYGVGESNGLHFYVMQFIEGLGLDEVLTELKGGGQQLKNREILSPLHVSRRDLLRRDHGAARGARAGAAGGGTSHALCASSRVDAGQDEITVDTCCSQADHPEPPFASGNAGRLSDIFTVSIPDEGQSIDVDEQVVPTFEPATYWHSVATIGAQAASALQYAHEQGILHRDIKPSNLLLDTHGTVWMLDFGLAKSSDQRDLTRSGDVLGTLRYMPPEAFSGRADARSDIYSLGLTLYELLALQPAFDEAASTRSIKQGRDLEPTPLDRLVPRIPRDLVTIVHKAIATDPERRYQTAEELAADLERFLDDEPIRARRTPLWEHAQRWARRNRALASAVAAIALLLVAINIAGPAVTLRLKSAYDAEVDARRRARVAEARAAVLLDLAREKERETLAALELARNRERELNRVLYRAEMSLAGQAAAERAGIQRVWELTSAWRHQAADLQDLRDWEWYYLHGLGRLAEQTITTDGGGATAVAWSPEGNRIAYGQEDGSVVVYNTETWRVIAHSNLHHAHVLAIGWSPDGSKCASLASQDADVRVWDPLTGKELVSVQLPGPRDWSGTVSFNADGSLLAADSRHKIAVWDVKTGRLQRSWDVEEATQVVWSPTDQRIAVASRSGRIAIWDMTSGQMVASHPVGAGCIAWGPRGERLAYSGQDRCVHFLHLETEEQVHCSIGHVADINALAFNGDGTRLASVGEDCTLRIWGAASGEELARLRGHTGAITAVAWHPRLPKLVTCAKDDTIQFWSADSCREQVLLQAHPAPIRSLTWGYDGDRLCVSSGSWTKLWDAHRHAQVLQRQGQRSALNPKQGVVAVALGPVIEIRDVASDKPLAELHGHTQGVTALVWCSDGSRLASAGWDGTARIWDPVTGEQIGRIALTHRNRQISWSPDGQYLAIIGNRDVQIWHVANGRQQAQFQSENQIHAVAWSPDGRLVASGGWDQTITVWDAMTAQTLTVLTGHTSPVTALCWNPAGTRLASGGQDQLVRIWDVDSRGELLSLSAHQAGVTSVAWSPDGLQIASGDRSGRIILWDSSLGHLQERTPQALAVINRRIEVDPTVAALDIRAGILETMGRTDEAQVDRRRISWIQQGRLAKLLNDPLTTKLLARKLQVEVEAAETACWIPLHPIAVTASDDTSFEVQADQSVLATGSGIAGVQYEFTARIDGPVTGLRLEMIPDQRLPHGGSGRSPKNGNFHLAEIEVRMEAGEESAADHEVAIEDCCSDSQPPVRSDRALRNAIDGDRATFWDTYPDHTQLRTAVFELARRGGLRQAETIIHVRLDSGISPWGPHGLGRFRLSATAGKQVVAGARLVQELKAIESRRAVYVAGAYAYLGESHKSATAFAAALRRVDEPRRQRAIVALAARFDAVICELAEMLPDNPWLLLAYADALERDGQAVRAERVRARSLSLLLARSDDKPEATFEALAAKADEYSQAGLHEWALTMLDAAYARSCELLSSEHACSIELLGQLAEARDRVGPWTEACALLQQEFALRRRLNGDKDPGAFSAGLKLASLYARNGETAKAVQLYVQVTEAAPLVDMNATQLAAFCLVWNGGTERHEQFARQILSVAKGTDAPRVARDTAKLVLIQPIADSELVTAAALLARRSVELTPDNMWSVLSLGMSHYRQEEYGQATRLLEQVARSPTKRLRLLACTFLAMAHYRQDHLEEARGHLDAVEQELGPLARATLPSPLAIHHDDLAIWLALREARRTMRDRDDT